MTDPRDGSGQDPSIGFQPARYWLKLYMTAAFSAICALASADYTRTSVPSVLSGPGRGDQIVVTTYGRSSGFCVDPDERRSLNHFLPRCTSAVIPRSNLSD